MTERVLVSPGVFTREIDLTVRPADPQGVGPVFIGKRAKGPAMVPVRTRDLDTDQAIFGVPSSNGTDFAAYANRAYLKQQAAPSTMIRLLGMSDTGVTPGYSIGDGTTGGLYAIGASGSNVVALVYSSGTLSLAGTLTSSVDQLAINITGYQHVTASLNRNDSRYIKKVLNSDPTQFSTYKHFVFAVYDYANKTPTNNAFFAQRVSVGSTMPRSFQDEFITGSTTSIISQPFDSQEYDLFGVGSIFAGDTANTEVKVSIRDIKKSTTPSVTEYGTFTLLVRKHDDNDRNPVVLETFAGLTLDPNSPNFICRRIGNRYRVWNKSTKKFEIFGDFENKSQYVYINATQALLDGAVPATSLPYGFRGYRTLVSGAVADKASFPTLPNVTQLTYKSDFSTKVYFGTAVIDNASGSLNYGVADKLKHIGRTLMNASSSNDTNFSLKHVSASISNISGFSHTARLTETQITALSTSIMYTSSTTNPSTSGSSGFTGYLSLENIENTALAKFTLPIHDGFDGVDVTKADPFSPEDMLTDQQYQTYAAKTAVDMISNPDEIDIYELCIPGNYSTKVTEHAITTVEDRGDCFFLMDISGSDVSTVTQNMTNRNLDTNYAGCWYPYVKMLDEVNNKLVKVSPTVVMPAVFAFSDKVSMPHFAPAGYSRGNLKNFGVTEAMDKLKKSERDSLYDNRINPIASFPEGGLVVWGQKTLQVKPSALDRINVRRMMLRLRKTIARIAAQELVFEPNVATTWEKFVNRITPILERLRQNLGIEDFRVFLDESTTTNDLKERNTILAKIMISPVRSSEFVILDFVLSPSGASFEN